MKCKYFNFGSTNVWCQLSVMQLLVVVVGTQSMTYGIINISRNCSINCSSNSYFWYNFRTLIWKRCRFTFSVKYTSWHTKCSHWFSFWSSSIKVVESITPLISKLASLSLNSWIASCISKIEFVFYLLVF